MVLFQDILYSLSAAIFTFDSKYVTGGNFNPSGANTKIYLYKFNANLDLDSVYTQPRVYDSLCPHAVVSDTTNADDCSVITKIDDPVAHPEKYGMSVCPNPAADRISLTFPELLLRQATFGSYQSTTVYHLWRSASLQIFDLQGRCVFSKEIPRDLRETPIEVSAWTPGLYLARLVFMNETVGEVKFLVRR